uniref:MICOS complex subunit n=1 Tax=Takifugu rubripes TaxID=31033 RepID=A0A3B5JYQ9_TAKRU
MRASVKVAVTNGVSLVRRRSDVTGSGAHAEGDSGAMRGSGCVSPITVFAAAGGGEHGAPLALDQLSLYPAPVQQKPRDVEPEAGQLEESVATLRRSVEPYTEWCRVTFKKIEPRLQSASRFGNEAYVYLKNPPQDLYPRAGIIGFTGLVGLLLARGSRMKKLVYPAGLMTLSASLYYPDKAAAVAKSTGESVYERAVHAYAAVESLLKSVRKRPTLLSAATFPA